jgi:hypothetical protein
MSDDDLELKILSDDELEASLQGEEETASHNPQQQETEAATYEGPERRSGKERRLKGDRREMLRFEPDKEQADRRSGKDRRKANQKPEDLWHFRDF